MIFDLDLDMVMVNQHARYLGQRSITSTVTVRTHTHTTNCSTWITKVVASNLVPIEVTGSCRYIEQLYPHGCFFGTIHIRM